MIEKRKEFKTVGHKIYAPQSNGIHKCIKHYRTPLVELKPDWDTIYKFKPVQGFWRNLYGFIVTSIQLVLNNIYYRILKMVL